MVQIINLENYKEVETEAEQIVSEYYDIDSQIKVLEKKKKELASKLKDNNPGNYQIGNYIAEVKEMSRTTFDNKSAKKFLEKYGEDVQDYEKETTFKKLSVKRLG